VAAPAPGTILAAMDAAAAGARAFSRGTLVEGLGGALSAAKESVERGPDELEVLREAGVVDAGAVGFTALLAGALGVLAGRPLAVTVPPGSAPRPPSPGPRFCANLAVAGTGLDREALTARLAPLGDSLMVVGEPSLLRVHVHTDDPERVEALCGESGRVTRAEVADMCREAEPGRAAAADP
jgi:dihydroxyacetone kinase-like predicted kinase